MTSSDVWDEETARRYDTETAAISGERHLAPLLDRLVALADGGRALEFAIGTGRIALPLAARGVPVSGIELSQPMVDQLRRSADEAAIPVIVGDMVTARVDGEFSLVYLVFNTLGNLRTQAEQVACFENAARHLAPGGRFLIEIGVPDLRRLPPGQDAVPFEVTPEHLGFDTIDTATQQATSHHYQREPDGSFRYSATNFRYVWPAETDLMARIAGLELESRAADWSGSPFTTDSTVQIAVWRKPA